MVSPRQSSKSPPWRRKRSRRLTSSCFAIAVASRVTILANANDIAATQLVFDAASPIDCDASIAPRGRLSESATSQSGSTACCAIRTVI